MDWGNIAKIGAQLAANYVAGRQQARADEANRAQVTNQQALQQNVQQNNIALQLAQLDLARRQLAERNRAERARQTAMGDVLSRVQDVSISRPSHITNIAVKGGLRPSALGPNARAAGQALSSEALAALLAGDQFDQVQVQRPIDLEANMPRESMLDKILAGLAVAGNVYQATQANGPSAGSQGASLPGNSVPNQTWMQRFLDLQGGK